MSVPPIVQYPLDLTGTHESNLVVDEVRDVTSNNARAFIPSAGPFYTESFVIYNDESGELLKPVDDYVLAQPFSQASLRTGKDVQCAVVLKVATPITVRFSYQVVGGEYSWNLQALADMIEELDLDERPIKWGAILGRPQAYPAAPHIHDIGDTFGWEYVVWQLERITNAIMIGDEASHDELRQQLAAMLVPLQEAIAALDDDLDEHVSDTSNPHQTTKAQVGLGNVQNYGIATTAEATTGTVSNKYMTPSLVTLLANRIVGEQLLVHTSNTNNPHTVTKVQVGLGNVDNFTTATQAQAEAGSANDRFMTPVRVRQAIAIQVGNSLDNHIDNKSNPHSVTKAQVGLGSVDNFATATQAQAVAATLNDRFMTPLRTKQAIDVIAGNALNTHIADTSNPHQTTKAQVGLGYVDNYPTASTAEGLAGVATDRFMTPATSTTLITRLAAESLLTHTSNANNPHAVTKAQVGLSNVQNYAVASVAEATTGTANNRYMTPQRVKEAIDVLAGAQINAHISDTSNPHQVTKAQVALGAVQNFGVATEAEAVDGTATDKYMTPQRTRQLIDAVSGVALTNHVNNKSNPHTVTKAQVGLGNIPNSITSARTSNSDAVLLTAAGMFNHVGSGDHDARYVRQNASVEGSTRVSGGRFQAYVSGAWRNVWPAQWGA